MEKLSLVTKARARREAKKKQQNLEKKMNGRQREQSLTFEKRSTHSTFSNFLFLFYQTCVQMLKQWVVGCAPPEYQPLIKLHIYEMNFFFVCLSSDSYVTSTSIHLIRLTSFTRQLLWWRWMVGVKRQAAEKLATAALGRFQFQTPHQMNRQRRVQSIRIRLS